MAKYILNYNGSKRRTVNCAVLDENYIANTYTVQFNNGVIKNVSKRRVKDLDHIDEAVLDKLKEVVSSLWDKMVKVGKGVFLKIKGKIADVISPINTMIAAQEIDGVGFYPSESLAKLAEELGVQPTVVEENGRESQDDINDINDFWKREIYQYYKNGEVAPANESVRYSRRNRRKLYEARNEIKLAMGGADTINVDTDELIKELAGQFRNIIRGDAPDAPICILGAPGIGKTQIVNQVINFFKKKGVNASLIQFCGSMLRKDDFFMPSVDFDKESPASDRIAFDTPKKWLPVYNPARARELGKTVEQLDDIANGGDGSGNGGGGIFFIDELTRIAPDVNNVLMQLVMNRKFDNYIIGSKWMFVGAANRISDMGRNGARVTWDPAQTARFRFLNFVPSFNAWIKWAESPIEGTDEPRVLPEIVSFLKEHQELWYSWAARNDQVDDDMVSAVYPTPRQWDTISKTIRTKYRNLNDPMLADLTDEFGMLSSSRSELSVQDKARVIGQYAGEKSAEVYRGWAAFDNLFSERDAQNVWKSGDKVAVRFNSNSSTISKAIEKIMASCPYEMVIDPNDKNKARKRYPITDKDIVNITDFILKCIYEMDKKKSTVNVQEINLCKEKLSDILTSFKYNYRLHQDNDNDLMILNHMENIFNDAINNTL